jgi:hypothetical protein
LLICVKSLDFKRNIFMKAVTKKAFAVVLFCGLALTSCKKDETTTSPTQMDSQAQKTAEDKSTASNVDDETSAMYDYASNIDPKSSGGRTEGTVLGAGNTSYNIATKTLTIDFGTSNVMCSDGRKRRGKVFIRFTEGEPRSLAHTVVISQENYAVNDIKVEGTRTDVVRTIINLAAGTLNSNRVITINSRKLTFTDNTTFTETGGYTFVITASISSNFQFTNFQYSATGGVNGKNRQNVNYTATIANPIIAKGSCNNLAFPIQGSFDINVIGLADKVMVDYGNGTCDKSYTISYRGQSITITL